MRFVQTLDLTNHNETEGYLLFDTPNLKIVSFAQLPIIHACFLPIILNLNHKMPFDFSGLISYLYFNILDLILLFFHLIGSVGK